MFHHFYSDFSAKQLMLRRWNEARKVVIERERGTVQTPIEGVSLAYTFADAKAADRHTTHYFEIFGNRAIYSDGWQAGTVHRAAWETQNRMRDGTLSSMQMPNCHGRGSFGAR